MNNSYAVNTGLTDCYIINKKNGNKHVSSCYSLDARIAGRIPIGFVSENARPSAALFISLSQTSQYATLLPPVYFSTPSFSSNLTIYCKWPIRISSIHLRCELPTCNNCSVFEVNEGDERQTASKSVANWEGCDRVLMRACQVYLCLKRRVLAFRQQVIAVTSRSLSE